MSDRCLRVKVMEQGDEVGGTGRRQAEVRSKPLPCPETRASCQAAHPLTLITPLTPNSQEPDAWGA